MHTFINLIKVNLETGTTAVVHLEQFVKMGLRTLCVAERDLTEEEYSEWLTLYQKANTLIESRTVSWFFFEKSD